MSTQTKRRISIFMRLVIAITVGCILLLGSWFWYLERYDGVTTSPNTFGDFGDKHYFAIDPERVLADLDHGETDVFTSEIATPENPIFNKTIEWHQSDYLKIAGNLNRFVWNETLEDWNLYYMNFKVTCHDNPTGFEFAEIAYFKTISQDLLQRSHVGRAFQIVPQDGYVVYSGEANFPQSPFDPWESLNLNKLRISAEDALKMADENGGRAARLSVQNECTICARLSGNIAWNIFISANDSGSTIFRIAVDPYTGKVE